MDYSKESQDRMKKIQDLKNAGVIPYANNYHGKQDITAVRAQESSAKDSEYLMQNGSEKVFKIAGRIMLSR